MKASIAVIAGLLIVGLQTAAAQTTTTPVEPAQKPAAAASEPEASPLTANINVTTNYKFRGQDQGTLKYFSPAVQGGFDYSKNGFYVGNWNSNIDFAGSIEMDIYGGYKGEIAKDFGYDVGVLQYYYPHHGGTSYNVTEIYGALTYSFASIKYSHTVSHDYFGLGSLSNSSGRNTGYFDVSANYPVIDKVTINAHVGYTNYADDLKKASHVPNYIDYKLGATYDLGSGFSVAGALIGANKRGFYGDYNKSRVVATISKSM